MGNINKFIDKWHMSERYEYAWVGIMSR